MAIDHAAGPSFGPPAVRVRHVQDDLLEQPVEAWVNAWNSNYMPR